MRKTITIIALITAAMVVMSYPVTAGWDELRAAVANLTANIDTSSELATIVTDETGTAGALVFSNSPTFTDDIQLGSAGTDGKLMIYSEQGANDYTVSVLSNAAMSSNASFYLPADEPGAESWLTMGTDGIIDYTTISAETLAVVTGRGASTSTLTTLTGGLTLGADDDASNVIIHHASTIQIFDASDDTSITIGPVADGTTTLGVTGTINATALQEGGVVVLNNDEMDASSELAAIIDDETGTAGNIVFSNSPTFDDDITLGKDGADGALKMYADQATDRLLTINVNAAMVSDMSLYMPADEPAAESWMTMGTDGVIDFTTISGETLAAVTARGATSAQTITLTAASPLVLGDDVAGGSANVAGSIKLWSSGDDAMYNTFTSGDNTANATYTLPVAMPAVSGYALTCTDAGVMSWAAVTSTLDSVLGAGNIADVAMTADPALANGFSIGYNGVSVEGSTSDGNEYLINYPADPSSGVTADLSTTISNAGLITNTFISANAATNSLTLSDLTEAVSGNTSATNSISFVMRGYDGAAESHEAARIEAYLAADWYSAGEGDYDSGVKLYTTYDGTERVTAILSESSGLVLNRSGTQFMAMATDTVGNFFDSAQSRPLVFTANQPAVSAYPTFGFAPSAALTPTGAGTINFVGIGGTYARSFNFAPTSGTSNFVAFTIYPAINQTGSASGNYTMLKINPTLTAVLGSENYLAWFGSGDLAKIAIDPSGNLVYEGAAENTYELTVTGPTFNDDSDYTRSMVVASTAPTAGAGVDAYTPSGQETRRYRVTYADLTAAATTQDVTIATVPAGSYIKMPIIVKVSTQGVFSDTLTLSLGDTGANYDDIIVDSDAKAATNTVYGDAQDGSETGTSLDNAGAWYPGKYYAAGTAIIAHFDGNATNLNAANCGGGSDPCLTAGVWDFYITYTTMP